MAICPICQARLAESEYGYAVHLERYHKNKPLEVKGSMLPINTSGRSKEQIVADWESSNYKHLIDGNDKTHPEECICNRCFQIRLDAIIESGERAVRESEGGN